MNFNEKLIELRKQKGLSQDEFGEKIGVSRQTVSKWELSQSYPDFQKLVFISDYYGITLDELVKDISVQDVRDKTVVEEQISDIHTDLTKFKKRFNTILNGLAIAGFVYLVIIGAVLLMVNFDTIINMF